MRVTIVSRIYRPEPSAASLFLGSIADELTDAGHDVTVITARPPRGTAASPVRERVRTFPVLRDRNGYLRGYLPYLSFDIPLSLRLLFSRRANVVLVEPPPTTGAVVRVICALRRIPYVYDAADIWADAAGMATDSGVVVKLLRAVEGFAMRGAARIVTISAGVVPRIRALEVTTPVAVTGFGADTTVFGYRKADPEPLFVYAGSYSTWHGAEILIDALALLRARGISHRLRFIGNGERTAIEARARELGVHSAVEFRSSMSPQDLSVHLASAAASLATLRPATGYEYAFTSKVYSSAAVGCPVVFAGPGPTSTFIAEASAHVRAGTAVPYDAAALANAMAQFVEHPLTAQEREDLASWTAQNHSMSAVAQRVAVELDAAAGAAA